MLKVCGITDPAEIDLLAAAGVELVGLSWGVPGGPHDLAREDWAALARADCWVVLSNDNKYAFVTNTLSAPAAHPACES